MLSDGIGWTATALFTASYFFRDLSAVRRVQMVAALLWACYGLALGALPVIVANLLVLAAAAAATARESRRNRPRATRQARA